MIEFDNNIGFMEMYCDFCDDSGESDGDFAYCIEALKFDGWRIRLADGDWEHTCPDCLKKEKEFPDVKI